MKKIIELPRQCYTIHVSREMLGNVISFEKKNEHVRKKAEYQDSKLQNPLMDWIMQTRRNWEI